MDRLVATLVALIGLAIAGPHAASVTRPAEREFSIDGQRALFVRPDHPNGGLVIYIHGASGSATAINEFPVLWLTASLLRHGFAVAASDAHGPQNWGNPASVEDYVRLNRRLDYRHVLILAQSMGGLDGMQLIDRIHPEGWAGIYPVCNAQSSYDSFELRPFVEEAWPGPPPHSLSPVKPRHLDGLKVLIWASPEDQVVSFEEDSERCTRYMRKHGADVRLVRTEGDHGDPSNFRPAWLTRFFESASGLSAVQP